MRTVRGTKYRKFRGYSQAARKGGTWYNPGYVGRVHLQFYSKVDKAWNFVCGKPNQHDLGGARGEIVEDDIPVTCVRCNKHAPDVVEYMDDIPSLDDFQ